MGLERTLFRTLETLFESYGLGDLSTGSFQEAFRNGSPDRDNYGNFSINHLGKRITVRYHVSFDNDDLLGSFENYLEVTH